MDAADTNKRNLNRRQRSFRVEAIVLRHRDYGEADRLLTLYTLERGKLTAIAKGVRKLKSRKAGHLEPFNRVSLQLAAGRDLAIITQAETLDGYLAIREDLLLLTCASYVVELVDRFIYEEGDNWAVYRLLKNTLGRLSGPYDPDLVIRYYEMRLLDLLGFRPLLFHCARCDREIQAEDQYFSAESGGILCPACGSVVPGVWEISLDALKYLRHFQRSNFQQASTAKLTAPVSREMERVMYHYLTYLLERKLNSPEFLRRIREE